MINLPGQKSQIITYLLFIIGFIILLLGSRWLIDGASSLGYRYGMPQLLIGLTIVALGTSLPELVINSFASYYGNDGLAIGNVLGSNIINTTLIIGVSAIIYPIAASDVRNMREVIICLLATLVLAGLANFSGMMGANPGISRFDGSILLLLLAFYLFFTFAKGGKKDIKMEAGIVPDAGVLKSMLFILLGIAGLFFGGQWILDGAGRITRDFGISQTTVGMTLIAATTSLPELVTSIVAATRKNTDLAIGNAIGSNLFNILLVLGVSALIHPIPFDRELNFELLILVVATGLVMLFIRVNIGKTTRAISSLEGILLVLFYFIFLGIIFF